MKHLNLETMFKILCLGPLSTAIACHAIIGLGVLIEEFHKGIFDIIIVGILYIIFGLPIFILLSYFVLFYSTIGVLLNIDLHEKIFFLPIIPLLSYSLFYALILNIIQNNFHSITIRFFIELISSIIISIIIYTVYFYYLPSSGYDDNHFNINFLYIVILSSVIVTLMLNYKCLIQIRHNHRL